MVLPATFPNLTALDLFVSVIETGSVSQAAAAHGISQPSATARIQALERQLGTTLLERTPSGSAPTVEGRVVAGWAIKVLRAADELATGAAALRAETSGLLRISASFTVAEYLLPTHLERFLRTRGGDSVSLEVANSTAVLERVAAGSVDLGFIESPGEVTTVNTQVVGHDTLVAVVGADHPWASRSTVPLEAFAVTPLVLREQGSGTREALDTAFAALGLAPPTSVLELGSTSAVLMAVSNGSSPTVVSRMAVRGDLARGRLVEVVVPGLSIERELRAAWRKRTKTSPMVRAFLAQLTGSPLREK